MLRHGSPSRRADRRGLSGEDTAGAPHRLICCVRTWSSLAKWRRALAWMQEASTGRISRFGYRVGTPVVHNLGGLHNGPSGESLQVKRAVTLGKTDCLKPKKRLWFKARWV